MAVFAIGDLHLPGNCEKPMDVFGSHWERHFETISQHWLEMIAPDDVVLIPGDISWAMQLAQVEDDLHAIEALPVFLQQHRKRTDPCGLRPLFFAYFNFFVFSNAATTAFMASERNAPFSKA